MNPLKLFETASIIVFALSFLSIMLVFFINPLIVFIISVFKKRTAWTDHAAKPSVSLLIAVHNAENLILDKIRNSLSLEYPSDMFEIVIFSDGSTDRTEQILKQFDHNAIRLLSSASHEGKTHAINQAAPLCSGEIIVFSDADALLNKHALSNLIKHFGDPSVGGVCGRRVISEEGHLKSAQGSYISFDSMIKTYESRSGSISSNDGKIYAIRKKLFQPIPEAVTDDLYVCLSVIKQGFRFAYEPDAKACIKVPSRNPGHEIIRRRRIVSRSLRGIYLLNAVLNPFRYGMFAFNLLVNKVMRRCLPVLLICLFLSSIVLSFNSPAFRIILFLQSVFYLFALSYRAVFRNMTAAKTARKISSAIYYFCLGNYGTFLGFIDFILGRKIKKWKPVKEGR